MWQLWYVAKWTCFPNPQIETHPKPPTLKHTRIPLYYTQLCLHHVYKLPYVSTLKCNHSWNTLNPRGHWTSLMHHLTFMNYWSSTQWTNALDQSSGVSLQSMYVRMGQLSPIPLKLDLGENVYWCKTINLLYICHIDKD
jgi:hypothetical protein